VELPCDFCGRMVEFKDLMVEDLEYGYLVGCNQCAGLETIVTYNERKE